MASLKASATWGSGGREGKTNFSLSISVNKYLLSLNVIVMLRRELKGVEQMRMGKDKKHKSLRMKGKRKVPERAQSS